MNSFVSSHLTQVANGGWTLGIGDPTFEGWSTTIGYFAVAYLCFCKARDLTKTGDNKNLIMIWWLITSLMVFLGFNKQLDLQSLLTEIGRRIAIEQGWYGNHRVVQRLFVFAMAAGGLGTLLASAWILRESLRELRLVLVGLTILITFIIIRAALFHHVDSFLGGWLVDLRINWIIELSGIALIGFGAYKQRRG